MKSSPTERDVAGIHIYDWVPDSPSHDVTFVYLHGLGDSGACAADLAETLVAQGFRVVLPDAPGHGTSVLAAPFTHEYRANAARRVIDDYIGAPVVLAGHSMGGETAAIVAARRPDLVRALLLEEPSVWFVDATPDEQTTMRQNLRSWIVGLQESTHQDRVAWARNDGPTWREVEYDPWAESKAGLNLDIFDGTDTWLGAGWVDVAQALMVPTLLLRGTPSEHTMDPQAAARLVELCPHIVDVVLPTGHCVRRDRPDEFAAYATGLLSTQSAAGA